MSMLRHTQLRMEASGAKHLICIVERYEKAHREGYLKAGIATTKMRLQLNHGFQLQETESTEDTVSFLTLRHHVMRDVFEVRARGQIGSELVAVADSRRTLDRLKTYTSFPQTASRARRTSRSSHHSLPTQAQIQKPTTSLYHPSSSSTHLMPSVTLTRHLAACCWRAMA